MYYFDLRKSLNGQYYFRFRAPNNETVMVSETYTAKQGALHAISLLKAHAANAPVRDNTAAAA